MLNHSKNLIITGGSFRIHEIYENALDKLYKETAPSALHTYPHAFNRPKCHEGTRKFILKRLMDWALKLSEQEFLIVWLYGAAGAGKSAIAHSFAEMCDVDKILLADFFFSRSDPSRSTARSFVATIAHQICTRYPAAKKAIEAAVQESPDIFNIRLQDQLEKLVVEPIRQAQALHNHPSPKLIIIDGLDECQDKSAHYDIVGLLRTLSRSMNDAGFAIRILVTSRPEHHLHRTFASPAITAILNRIALNDDYVADADIRRFVVDKLQSVKDDDPHIPDSWPEDANVDKLVKKASGQFIYATLAMTFIASGTCGSLRALEIVLGAQPAPNLGGMPFAELDTMYRYLLSLYSDVENAKLILGVRLITAAELGSRSRYRSNEVPLTSISQISSLLDVEPTEISCLAKHLSAIIQNDNGFLRIHHTSLRDFLQDPRRSFEYYVNDGRLHNRVTTICLNRHLKHSDFVDFWHPTYRADDCRLRHSDFAIIVRMAEPEAQLRSLCVGFLTYLCSKQSDLSVIWNWPTVLRYRLTLQNLLEPEDRNLIDGLIYTLLLDDLSPMHYWSREDRLIVQCTLEVNGPCCAFLLRFKNGRSEPWYQSVAFKIHELTSSTFNPDLDFVKQFLYSPLGMGFPPCTSEDFRCVTAHLWDFLVSNEDRMPSDIYLYCSNSIAAFLPHCSHDMTFVQRINASATLYEHHKCLRRRTFVDACVNYVQASNTAPSPQLLQLSNNLLHAEWSGLH